MIFLIYFNIIGNKLNMKASFQGAFRGKENLSKDNSALKVV